MILAMFCFTGLPVTEPSFKNRSSQSAKPQPGNDQSQTAAAGGKRTIKLVKNKKKPTNDETPKSTPKKRPARGTCGVLHLPF